MYVGDKHVIFPNNRIMWNACSTVFCNCVKFSIFNYLRRSKYENSLMSFLMKVKSLTLYNTHATELHYQKYWSNNRSI